MRAAAAEADAVVIVTTYHGRVPAVINNAIDWLTRRWDEAALHDKPLAVIGRASRCYSGVWSHQSAAADRPAAHRVVESITVSNLREAIKMLAGEVHEGDAGRDRRYRRYSPTAKLGELMRYKAIVATLGATSLLAMGITAAA